MGRLSKMQTYQEIAIELDRLETIAAGITLRRNKLIRKLCVLSGVEQGRSDKDKS